VDLEELRKILLSQKGATEEMPFGPDVLVFKVMGKMFALVAWEADPLRISLKCDPNHALALRAMYSAVIPGYHLNKEHWNTVILDDTVPVAEVLKMIDDSYNLVVASLSKTNQCKFRDHSKLI